MKELSIIFPTLDEKLPILQRTLAPLLTGIKGKDAEIIIIDNSKYERHTFNHKQIRHIKNSRNVGVGASFNQGVELSDSSRVVLMGSDVLVRKGWYNRVIKTLDEHPSTIFNCVNSGFNDKTKPFTPRRVKRYGAFVLYKVTKQDLPSASPLQNDKKYSKILQGKWNYREPEPRAEFAAIRCLMGAFYWMHKSDYQKIHGWNGHTHWGSLEPFLSIKARAHGLHLVVDKKLEASHYFGREIIRPIRMDLQYQNMLFMAETMFSTALRDELVWYLRYGDREERIEKLNVNRARVALKRAHGLVTTERDYNQRHFKYGLINNWKYFNTKMI